MKRIIKLLPLLAWLLCTGTALAQTDSLRYVVHGSVVDAATGRPLPDVGISLPGTRYATVTNQDGSFVIKSDVPPRSVSCSLLGYQPVTEPVPADLSVRMRVRLEPVTYMLDPARIYSGDPLYLLLDAIDRITENGPSDPELFDCFYRETVRKRQRFIYVSEAVVRMYKSSFLKSAWRDKASVLKGRLLTSPRQSDTLGVKVVGGPAMAVELDVVKNRTFILDRNDLQYYRVELLAPAYIDNRPQHVLRLIPTVKAEEALNYGTVYLDQETLAFSRVELTLDVSNEVAATRAMLISKPKGLRFKPKEMSLLLHYRMEDGKYRLSYQRTVFRFNCDWRRRLFATDFTAVAEMVVTNRLSGVMTDVIPRSEVFHGNEALSDKTGYFADPDFWKDYNIIEPTESLETAVKKLKK